MAFGDKFRDTMSTVLGDALYKAGTKAEQPQATIGDMLPIPFVILEGPRGLLHLIRHSDDPDVCPPKLKAFLTTWLDQFDAALHQYLVNHYGKESLPVANGISRQVILAQAKYLQALETEQKSDEVSDLERHFGMDSAPRDE